MTALYGPDRQARVRSMQRSQVSGSRKWPVCLSQEYKSICPAGNSACAPWVPAALFRGQTTRRNVCTGAVMPVRSLKERSVNAKRGERRARDRFTHPQRFIPEPSDCFTAVSVPWAYPGEGPHPLQSRRGVRLGAVVASGRFSQG